MWYLLVAAGAGYLGWQKAHKIRPLCGQDERTTLPSSPPATPNKEFYSSLADSTPNISNIVHDASSGLNSLLQNSSSGGFDVLLDKDISLSPQEIKCNKRSVCEAFVVNSVQVAMETEDQLVFTSKCSSNSSAITNNKEEEQLEEELSSLPSSCCSSSSTVINSPRDNHSILQRYDGSFQYQEKEEGSQPIWQSGFSQFQGKEQKKPFGISQDQNTNSSLNIKSDGEDAFVMTQNQYAEALQRAGFGNCKASLLDCIVAAPKMNMTSVISSNGAAVTDKRLDAGIHTPLSFIGKRPRDNTRADIVIDDFECTHTSKSDAKQGISPTVGRKNRSLSSPCRRIALEKVDDECTHTSNTDAKQGTSPAVTRKNRSLSSPCHSIALEKASENLGDVQSEAFVSFGLAIAVCFMVSSSKIEMEKMGKVLRETEDLVSDMRKELEERKIRACSLEEDNDEFFTINPNNTARQEYITGKIAKNINTLCKNGIFDQESTRSDMSEEMVQNQSHMCGIECECGAESYYVENNAQRSDHYSTSNGKLHRVYCDSEDESDSEESGENDCAMSMVELETKLWNVFQQRQEERISELEGALAIALSKLHAKEEELRWWKNRASWLMEQSFGSASGKLQSELFTKNQVERVEGFECANEEGGETSFSIVEGSKEIFRVKDSYPILSGRPNSSVRTSSTCSSSSGRSVLSIDVMTSAD